MLNYLLKRFSEKEIYDSQWILYFIKKRDNRLFRILNLLKYKRMCLRYNSYIPYSLKIGDNTTFPHGLCGIFISSGASIGDNCVIFHQVTIGSVSSKGSKHNGSPRIGNNVLIGAGAKVIGNITIGDNVRIGANAVVSFDVPSNSTVVLEKPRVITHSHTCDNSFIKISEVN